MRRSIRRAALLAVVVAASAAQARAQYVFPGGYAGWGGWGGGASTVAESSARGMGAFAAGAGAYNQQTAVARSINADTAMQVNQYMYECQQEHNRNEMARLARRQNNVNETASTTYKRLHDNPTPRDIHSGDALNVVFDELTDPKVYTRVVQAAMRPVESDLVRNIEFRYAAGMIAISLEGLTARGVPDALRTNPAFEAERKALRTLIAKAREESAEQGQVSIDTLQKCRVAIKALQDKVDATYERGRPERDEADNFLKALYGLSKMLETPQVAKFLRGLDGVQSTTLGKLITFMHTFNLRFGEAKSPVQEAVYDQLYPMLVSLRDQAQVRSLNPATGPSTPPDPKKATAFFSGMSFDHFGPQPDPHTGVIPAPPRPR